jgi:serine/threonine-protein kinase SRPK3
MGVCGTYQKCVKYMLMGGCSPDFTAANILLQLVNIDEWTIEEIRDRLGIPETRRVYRSAGATENLSEPKYTVKESSMKEVHPKWLSDQIMIIDFGI